MRIGILHNYALSGSGSNTYVLGLSRTLVRLGHEVIVISRELNYGRYGFFSYSNTHNGEYILPAQELHTEKMPGRAIGYSLTFDPYIGIETHPECQGAEFFSKCSQPDLEEYITKSIKAVQDIITKEKIEVLHANHEVPLPYIASKVKELTKVPFVVTLHGSHIEYVLRKDPPRYRPLVEQGLQASHRVIVTTRDVEERCIANATVNVAKFILIPVGVDTALFNPNREISSTQLTNQVTGESIDLSALRKERAIVAFVGKVTADKGVHLLPFMIPEIARTFQETKFIIVGGGDLLSPLISFARGELSLDDFLSASQKKHILIKNYVLGKEYNAYLESLTQILTKHCIILGLQPFEIVQKLLAVSNICLIPSIIDEALPMVTLEAMSSGALPIARDYSGFKEILARIRAKIPIIAPALNIPGEAENLVSAFISCIIRALQRMNSPSQSELIARSLRNLAVREYDWRIITNRIIQEYQSAISKKGE